MSKEKSSTKNAVVLGQDTNFTKLAALASDAVVLKLAAKDLAVDEGVQEGSTVVVVDPSGTNTVIRGDAAAIKAAAEAGEEIPVAVITPAAFKSLKVKPAEPKTGNGSNRIKEGWGF